jgi:hypothetical protein
VDDSYHEYFDPDDRDSLVDELIAPWLGKRFDPLIDIGTDQAALAILIGELLCEKTPCWKGTREKIGAKLVAALEKGEWRTFAWIAERLEIGLLEENKNEYAVLIKHLEDQACFHGEAGVAHRKCALKKECAFGRMCHPTKAILPTKADFKRKRESASLVVASDKTDATLLKRLKIDLPQKRRGDGKKGPPRG